MIERRIVLSSAFDRLTPALFLDRDGVIIQDRHYAKKQEDVSLCAGVRDLIVSAFDVGYAVVVVTNQSGIARGLLTWQDVEAVNTRMLALLGPRAQPTALYVNGHGPDAAPHSWRKPSPAMLFDASEHLNLDLSRSVLIGDRLTDIQAGVAAGVSEVCHVLTGHGREERIAIQDWHKACQVTAGQPISRLLLLQNLQGVSIHQLIADHCA